jgi:hypothetical protein
VMAVKPKAKLQSFFKPASQTSQVATLPVEADAEEYDSTEGDDD